MLTERKSEKSTKVKIIISASSVVLISLIIILIVVLTKKKIDDIPVDAFGGLTNSQWEALRDQVKE